MEDKDLRMTWVRLLDNLTRNLDNLTRNLDNLTRNLEKLNERLSKEKTVTYPANHLKEEVWELYVKGYSAPRIARKLKLTVGQVKYRIAKVREEG